jgi:hypothetical protein
VYLGGTFLEACGEEFYNTFALISPDGDLLGTIRKARAASFETFFFRDGGWGPHVIDTELGPIGVGICYENMLAASPLLFTAKCATPTFSLRSSLCLFGPHQQNLVCCMCPCVPACGSPAGNQVHVAVLVDHLFVQDCIWIASGKEQRGPAICMSRLWCLLKSLMPAPQHQAGGNLMTAKDCARGILCFDHSWSFRCVEHRSNDSTQTDRCVWRCVCKQSVEKRGEEYGHADRSVEDVKGRGEEMI